MNRIWPGQAKTPLAQVFPARHILDSTEQSLKNLGVEAIAVQQFHVWNDAWLDDPEWEKSSVRIARLKEEGKVLHWGISINDHAPETALRVLEDPIFETAQVIYNIYDRSPERALFPLAKRKPLGIIVRVPFDEGALTGQIKADTVFPPGDWRADYFAGKRKAEVERRAEGVSGLVGRGGEKVSRVAPRVFFGAPGSFSRLPPTR